MRGCIAVEMKTVAFDIAGASQSPLFHHCVAQMLSHSTSINARAIVQLLLTYTSHNRKTIQHAHGQQSTDLLN